jgi:hypothetical protein
MRCRGIECVSVPGVPAQPAPRRLLVSGDVLPGWFHRFIVIHRGNRRTDHGVPIRISPCVKPICSEPVDSTHPDTQGPQVGHAHDVALAGDAHQHGRSRPMRRRASGASIISAREPVASVMCSRRRAAASSLAMPARSNTAMGHSDRPRSLALTGQRSRHIALRIGRSRGDGQAVCGRLARPSCERICERNAVKRPTRHEISRDGVDVAIGVTCEFELRDTTVKAVSS